MMDGESTVETKESKPTRPAPTGSPPAAAARSSGEGAKAAPTGGANGDVAASLHGMFGADLLYMVAAAFQLVLTGLITPLLTRTLGPTGYGQVTLATAATQILSLGLALGLPFAVQREFARRGSRDAQGVVAFATTAVAAGAAVLVGSAPLWHSVAGIDAIGNARLAALWGSGFALGLTCLALLRSQKRLKVFMAVALLQSAGAQGFGLGLAALGPATVTRYLTGVVIGQAGALVVAVVTLRPSWQPWAQGGLLRRTLKFSLPMVPQQLSSFTLAAGDRIVIRHELGSAATGRYAVAYNIGSLGIMLLTFVNQAWLPRTFSMREPEGRGQLLSASRDVLSIILVPVVLLLTICEPVMLHIWAPSDFHPGSLGEIVSLVAISTFVYGQFLANLRGLITLGSTGRAAAMTAVCAVGNILLNVLLIPPLGILGSALATLIAYVALALVTRVPRRSGLVLHRPSGMLLAIIALAAVLAVTLGYLPDTNTWLFVRLAIGVAVSLVAAGAGFLIRRGTTSPARLMRRLLLEGGHAGN